MITYERYDEFKTDLDADKTGYVGTQRYRQDKGMTQLEVNHYRRRLRAELRFDGGQVLPTPVSSTNFSMVLTDTEATSTTLARRQDLRHVQTRLTNILTDMKILMSNQKSEDHDALASARSLEFDGIKTLSESLREFETVLLQSNQMRREARHI